MALGSAVPATAHTINLGACSGAYCVPAIDDPPAAKTHAGAKIRLSRSTVSRNDRANDPSPALVFERPATPAIFASGSPSPPSSGDAQARGWVSPYDYFGDVADIPLSAGARAELATASFFLFAPSFLDRLMFTDGLSADALSGESSPPPK